MSGVAVTSTNEDIEFLETFSLTRFPSSTLLKLFFQSKINFFKAWIRVSWDKRISFQICNEEYILKIASSSKWHTNRANSSTLSPSKSACPLCAFFSSFPQSLGVAKEAPNKLLFGLSILKIARRNHQCQEFFDVRTKGWHSLSHSLPLSLSLSECGSQQEANVYRMPRLESKQLSLG